MPPDHISTHAAAFGPGPGKLPDVALDIPRDDLREDICRLLSESQHRLITLTGAGGSGKTWLAAAVTSTLRHRLSECVAFVRLDDVREPEALMQAIASQLAREPTDTPEAALEEVARAIEGRPFLIVLDTFEHLAHAAPIVADLIAHCPQLTILATSRRPMGLRVERVIRLPPLRCSESGEVDTIDELARFESGAMFLATAHAVAATHPVTDVQASAVASICRRLDGSPLAIRLAAAQLPLLTPEEIHGKIDEPLDFLADTAGDAPARQHSLRASCDWSYDLLGPGERACFRRLAVFSGSFPLAAALAVTSSRSESDSAMVLSQLRVLVDHALLRRIETSDANEPRFWLGAAERAYAGEQLDCSGERASTTRQLARWLLANAEQRTPHHPPPEDDQWLARIAAEDANMAIAREWIIDTQNWQFGLRLATALYQYWLTRGCHDGERKWLRHALDIVPTTVSREFASQRARATHLLGLLSHTIGAFDEAETAYRSALNLRRELGDRSGEITTMHNMGVLSASRGDLESATDQLRESCERARAIGDRDTLAMSLCYLAHVLNALGQRHAAWETLQDAGSVLREHGSTRLRAYHAYCLGDVLWSKGIRQDAREQWQRCLDRSIKIGDTHSRAAAALSLSLVAREEKRLADAADHCLDAFRCLDIRQDRRLQAEALLTCAMVATATSEWSLATRLFGAGDAILDSLAAVPLPRQRDERAQGMRAARQAVGARVAAAGVEIGRAMRTEDAIAAATTFAATLVASAANPAGTGRNAVSLTPREHDVLELLVRGLTNREIGDLLELSHRTVATHVTNLLGKLHVTTRAAAAGEAVRLDLVTAATYLEPAI